ncbi:hypothetical protein [Microbacterium sp. NPDC057650]|uniref:hypothetical protein n=1 Tax=unclassified Microbacterium TaxID=2609290 RepID=UPI00366B50D9
MPVLFVPVRLPRPLRRVRLVLLRQRSRWRHRMLLSMVRTSTWIYFAAAGVIGFGGLEVMFGAFLIAPELLPFALAALALVWVLRRERRRVRLGVLRLRRRRSRRRAERTSPSR